MIAREYAASLALKGAVPASEVLAVSAYEGVGWMAVLERHARLTGERNKLKERASGSGAGCG